jgi:hypothetical protein
MSFAKRQLEELSDEERADLLGETEEDNEQRPDRDREGTSEALQ